MKIGYARTSTVDQEAGLEAQVRDLTAAGCDRIFQEKVSSVADRPEFEAMIDGFIQNGDIVYVTKLDRLARSVLDLHLIAARLDAKGCQLNVMNLGLDTSTATGKLIFSIIGAIAEFERGMMLERQSEGIAKAKRDGKYAMCGRPKTAALQADRIAELWDNGNGMSKPAIAVELGIGERSVYRILAAPKPGAGVLPRSNIEVRMPPGAGVPA